MTVTANGQGPYAPPRVLLDILDRYRDRGLPSPINADVLARSGLVTDSLNPRTLQAMQLLDLIDDKGVPTDHMEALRRVPQAEYKSRLQAWLKEAYHDVFTFVDPAKDDATSIRDAFRHYIPNGQQDRMATLFTGLCAAAGLMPEKAQGPTPTRPAPTRLRVLPPVRTRTRVVEAVGTATGHRQTDLPPALAGLLASLPKDGKGWTQDQRNKFITTFGAVIDFVIPIKSEAEEAQ